MFTSSSDLTVARKEISSFWLGVGKWALDRTAVPFFNKIVKPAYKSDTVQGWKWQAQEWGKTGAMTVCAWVARRVTKDSNPLINELVDNLKVLQQKTKVLIEASQAADGIAIEVPAGFFPKEAILPLLKTLKDDSQSMLQDAREQGIIIELTQELTDAIVVIDDQIQEEEPDIQKLNEQFVKVIAFLERVQTAQRGALTKVVEEVSSTTKKIIAAPDKPAALMTLGNRAVTFISQALSQEQSRSAQTLAQALITLQAAAPLEEKEDDKGKDEAINLPTEERQNAMGLISHALSTNLIDERHKPLFTALRDAMDERIYPPNFPAELNQAILFLSAGKPVAPTKPSNDAERKKALAYIIGRVVPEPTVFDPPNELIPDLKTKIDEITDLGIKKALTQLLLPSENPKEDIFSRIYKEAQKKAGEDKMLLEAVFYQTLEAEFNDKNRSMVQHVKYWVIINLIKPVLESYASNIAGRIKTDLETFITRDPKKRIEDVVNIVLSPINDHMNIYTQQVNKFGQPQIPDLVESPDKTLISYFNTVVFVNGKPGFDRFTSVILDKYAPSFTSILSATLAKAKPLTFLREKFPKAVEFAQWKSVKGVYIGTQVAGLWLLFLRSGKVGKTAVIGASLYLLGALNYIIDAAVRYKTKQEMVKLLTSTIFKNENDANTDEEKHSETQLSINKFILQKLKNFNKKGIKGEKPVPRKLFSDDSTRELMLEVVDSILKVLPISNLRFIGDFKPTTIKGLFAEGYSELTGLASPSIADEFLRAIETFLSDEKNGDDLGALSQLIWFSVNSLEKTMKEGASGEMAEMSQTETQIKQHLRIAIQSVVEEGVDTTVKPEKQVQKNVDATIELLKKHTDALIAIMSAADTPALQEQWKQLNEIIIDISTEWEGTKIEKIKWKGGEIVIAFKGATKDLNDLLVQIKADQDQKEKIDNQLTDLNENMNEIERLPLSDTTGKLEFLLQKSYLSKELKVKINHYNAFLKRYLSTKPTTETNELAKTRKAEFNRDLAHELKTIQAKRDALTSEMSRLANQIKEEEIPKLQNWKDSHLKPIKIKPEDVPNLAEKLLKIGEFVLRTKVDEVMHGPVTSNVKKVIDFKKKSYHWNDILHRVMIAAAKRIG